MGFWTFILLIVAMGCITSIIQARYKARHGIVEDWLGNQTKLPPEPDSALQREVEELRERIKVLERIATDGRHTRAIAEEIESLRDR